MKKRKICTHVNISVACSYCLIILLICTFDLFKELLKVFSERVMHRKPTLSIVASTTFTWMLVLQTNCTNLENVAFAIVDSLQKQYCIKVTSTWLFTFSLACCLWIFHCNDSFYVSLLQLTKINN